MVKLRLDRFFFTVLAVPLDFLAVIFAGFVAWALRFSPWVQTLRPVAFGLAFSEYLALIFVAALFTVAAIATTGLYRFPHSEIGRIGAAARIALSTSATLAAAAFAIFFRQELFDSRFLVLATWILGTAFIIGERSVVALFEDFLTKRFGIGLRKALVIGGDTVTDQLIRALERNPAFGMRIAKRLSEPDLEEVAVSLGNPGIEAIVLANPDYPRERIVELVDFAQERRLAFWFVPNLFQTLTANARADLIGGIPVVELRRTALDGWGRVFKRTLDIAGAFVLLVLCAPLMALIALAVKLEDPQGPVIYRNRRAGEHGKFFDTLKFRSMYWKHSTGPGAPDPEGAITFERELARRQSVRKGPVWKILNDPRRTRVGRFLEHTSLDELPQLFNVFLGEMSLVGPRPHMLEQVAEYEKRHRRVLDIKPGITGVAQISGRSDLDFDEEVRLDTYYIEHWSLWLDLKIIAATPFVVLMRRHRS